MIPTRDYIAAARELRREGEYYNDQGWCLSMSDQWTPIIITVTLYLLCYFDFGALVFKLERWTFDFG